MKYMVLDATGEFPIGFYDEDVHGPREVPVYGDKPAPTEDDPNPEAPIVGHEANPAYPPGGVEVEDEVWTDFIHNQGQRKWDVAKKAFVSYTAPPVVRECIMTGRDVVDGMSPAQAKAADADDPRNLARLAAAPLASMVKGPIARIEKSAGLSPGTLLSQAKATG